MISHKSINDIFETVRIEDIVDEFVSLKNSGSNLKGLCPFHNEKTPSFMVSPSKNIFKCFGCGKGGNAVHFLMEHEGLSYPEALRLIAKRYQIEIEETYDRDRSEEQDLKTDSLYLINEFASDYFQKNLFTTQEGRSIGLSYFKERGFLEKTIQKFELGYALKSSAHLTKTALENSYNVELLKELGLTTKTNQDFFNERVVFPIHNLGGRVIAFGARNLNSEKRSPKYLNSPESEIYHKSKTLYGLHFAKSAIRKEDECLLVEGYTDVISLHQNGVENVVASSGTSMTEDQIRMIKRFTTNIKILYDSDQAGIKAALRGIDLILSQDLNVKIVLLPESEDPDSYIRNHGHKKFTDFLKKQAQDFILFKANQISEEASRDPIRKTKLVKDIVTSIAKIPDPVKRSLYVKECSKLLEVDESLLTEETNHAVKLEVRQQRLRHNTFSRTGAEDPVRKNRNKTGKEFSGVVVKDDPRERQIIRNIINYGDQFYDEESQIYLAEYIIANIRDVIDKFENPIYQDIINQTIELIKIDKRVDSQIFTNHINMEICQLAVSLLDDPDEYAGWDDKGFILQTQKRREENYIEDSNRAINRLIEREQQNEIHQVDNRIISSEDEEERRNLIKVRTKMKNNLSEIQSGQGTVVICYSKFK